MDLESKKEVSNYKKVPQSMINVITHVSFFLVLLYYDAPFPHHDPHLQPLRVVLKKEASYRLKKVEVRRKDAIDQVIGTMMMRMTLWLHTLNPCLILITHTFHRTFSILIPYTHASYLILIRMYTVSDPIHLL